ncbi:hypothetical protein CG709_04995, partial [Lachnotalea glycerini]
AGCLTFFKPSGRMIGGKGVSATAMVAGRCVEMTMTDAGHGTINNAGNYVILDQAYTVHKVIDSCLNIKE